MFDWNENGKTDDSDHAFTAFVIDDLNRKIFRDDEPTEGGSDDAFMDSNDSYIDYSDHDSCNDD